MSLFASKSQYLSEDTIAALSTEIGGALAIVRVSGSQSLEIYWKICGEFHSMEKGHGSMPTPNPNYNHRIKIFTESHDLLDDAMACYFKSPSSFTGEDMVEFCIHGSGFIARRLLQTIIHYGARQANPGEFSFRAVRNGKISLFQAEAISDLYAATNEKATALALEKITQGHSSELANLHTQLRTLLALAEVGIDFSDQDVHETSMPQLKEKLFELIKRFEILKDSYKRGIKLQEGLTLAFLGAPNAGKSSLFNALLREERSIVSALPGTTRDLVSEKIELRFQNRTLAVRLEDTAGIRESHDPIESLGVQRSRDAAKKADVILWVLDSTRHEFHEFNDDALTQSIGKEWNDFNLSQHQEKTLAVLTKRDLSSGDAHLQKWTDLMSTFNIPTLIVSATENRGLDSLVATLFSHFDRLTPRAFSETLITRLNHWQTVDRTLETLARGLTSPSHELLASDLRQALHDLRSFFGDTAPDDILNQIFSEFCIGK